jgi:hypothetical protein
MAGPLRQLYNVMKELYGPCLSFEAKSRCILRDSMFLVEIDAPLIQR